MTEPRQNDARELWALYEKGVDYGTLSGRYTNAEKCWRFFEGDQWYGIRNADGGLPFYNIIKPVINYKKAKIAMNTKTITFSLNEEDREGVVDAINDQIRAAWELGKMDRLCWEIVETALICGDALVYFPNGQLFEQGADLCGHDPLWRFAQILDGCHVILGDEGEPELQRQPYIILTERLLTEKVRQEAKKNGLMESEICMITPDSRSRTEVTTGIEQDFGYSESYTTGILYMERTEAGIRFCRAVRDVIYQPYQTIRGLNYYPIAAYTVNRQKGKARGLGEVLPMIPNQIEINRTLVRRSDAVRSGAYPKLIYNEDFISNPQDLEVAGAAIAVRDGLNINDVMQMVGYLQPAPISGEASQLESEMISVTKELAGAGDATLGNVNPENASGAAITAVQDQADIPMNREVAAFSQLIEEIALVWFHLILAYNPISYQGKREVVSAEHLRKLCPMLEIDVSSTIPDTVNARLNTLYNLLGGGYITFDEFMELIDSTANIPVEKLKSIRAEAKKEQELQQAAVMDQQAAEIENATAEAQLDGMMAEAEAQELYAGMMGG